MSGKKQGITIRSGAAEYLTFIAAVGDSGCSFEMRYQDENIWLTQKMLAELYNVDVRTINYHILKVYEDGELIEEATIRNFRIVQTEGVRSVERDVKHYSLQVIIAVGFKVNSERAVQFRKWVNKIAKDYTIQGWVMDEERLKSGGSVLTRDYFDKQLEKIREIRLSERRFYQKITDIYATALDYDKTAKTTREFFAKVQNKMHYAVHGNTAAEIIYRRADGECENMGLTTWDDAPHGKIQRYDVVVAKNYLSEEEMRSLESIVSAYLDLAENRARRRLPMTMEDWAKYLDRILQADDRELLTNAGTISAEIANEHALCEFEKYRVTQDRLFESDFDRQLNLLEQKRNGMKIVFMGSAEFGLPALDMLLSRHQVAAVVSTPAKPKGRGLKLFDSPVTEFAKSRGIETVLTPENLLDPEFISRLTSIGAGLFVVVAFRILPKDVYALPALGTVNIHASLLPRYRGAAPIQRAVEAGERETGVTIFRIDEGIDTGEIILQKKLSIGETETTPELYERLSAAGADALSEAIDALTSGNFSPLAQDSAEATRAPKLSRQEGYIDWKLPAPAIFNKIRAFKPFPGTYFFINGKRINIEWGECIDMLYHNQHNKQPGTVLTAKGDYIDVQCGGEGGGVLRISKVKPEGRPSMDVRAFLSGHTIAEGTVLE